MKGVDIRSISPDLFPPLLHQIPDPPDSLYLRGPYPNPDEHHFLAVVGSRKHTDYGKKVVQQLITSLEGTPTVIVSGLALGIDALSHTTALDTGLTTVAIPGSGLSDRVLYPKSNRHIAKRILREGGCLLSEYKPDFKAQPWAFPKRNRIMAGLSHTLLVIEAAQKSGTLITARLALEYNRNVCVVPGPITSPTSRGCNQLIKDGAMPVTSFNDLLQELGYSTTPSTAPLFSDVSQDEQYILSHLTKPRTKKELLSLLELPDHVITNLLSSLEVKGIIHTRLGKICIRKHT